MLWRKDISSKEKENFTESELQQKDLFDETYEIGVYFTGDLPKKKIHIIIKAPGKYAISFSKPAYLLTVLSSLKALPLVSEARFRFLATHICDPANFAI